MLDFAYVALAVLWAAAVQAVLVSLYDVFRGSRHASRKSRTLLGVGAGLFAIVTLPFMGSEPVLFVASGCLLTMWNVYVGIAFVMARARG